MIQSSFVLLAHPRARGGAHSSPSLVLRWRGAAEAINRSLLVRAQRRQDESSTVVCCAAEAKQKPFFLLRGRRGAAQIIKSSKQGLPRAAAEGKQPNQNIVLRRTVG